MPIKEIWTQVEYLDDVYLLSNFGHLAKVAGFDNDSLKNNSPKEFGDAFRYQRLKYDVSRGQFGWVVDTVCERDVFIARSVLLEEFLDSGLPVQVDTSNDDAALLYFNHNTAKIVEPEEIKAARKTQQPTATS